MVYENSSFSESVFFLKNYFDISPENQFVFSLVPISKGEILKLICLDSAPPLPS